MKVNQKVEIIFIDYIGLIATENPTALACELEIPIVAKQRNGMTGDVPLMFLANYTKFENAAKDE